MIPLSIFFIEKHADFPGRPSHVTPPPPPALICDPPSQPACVTHLDVPVPGHHGEYRPSGGRVLRDDGPVRLALEVRVTVVTVDLHLDRGVGAPLRVTVITGTDHKLKNKNKGVHNHE